jgi:hypothetical protein
MKTFVAPIIFLLIGIAIGCYSGYRYCDRHTTNEAIQQMVEGDESSNAMTAMLAAAAVRYIDSGETSNAVLVLSHPIASYYCVYGTRAGTNAQRLKVRAYIEQTAQTNQVVAAQIKKEMSW